jgi:hypothetical protein
LGEGRARRCDYDRAKCYKKFTAIVHATPCLGSQYARIWERQQTYAFSAACRCGVSINRQNKM